MKILHVFDHSVPIQDGYAYRSLNILREQRVQGYSTAHLTSSKQAGDCVTFEQVEDMQFYRTPRASKRWAHLPVLDQWAVVSSLSDRLDAVIQAEEPDVLHAHSPPLVGLAACRAGRQAGLPVIYEIRAFWEDAAVDKGACREGDLRYRLTRMLETYVMGQAAAVTCICQGLHDDIIGRGVPAPKVTVVPNAIDPKQFATSRHYDAELAAGLGVTRGNTIGFVGSFYAYEGLRLLVAALPEILRERPRLKLLLVGGGNDDALLRSDVAALGLNEQVVFAGRVPHAEIDRYYDLIDVMVYPRLSMRLTELVTPLKPLEAMIQDRLVVASDVGGHRELIEHERTGLLFKAGDPAALASVILRLFQDRALQERLRVNARNYVMGERTWRRSVARYGAVYAAALAA